MTMDYFERRQSQLTNELNELTASIALLHQHQEAETRKMLIFKDAIFRTALQATRQAIVGAARRHKEAKAILFAILFGLCGWLAIFVAAAIGWPWQARVATWIIVCIAPLIGYWLGRRTTELDPPLDELMKTTVLKLGVRTQVMPVDGNRPDPEIAVFDETTAPLSLVSNWDTASMSDVATFLSLHTKTSTGSKGLGLLPITPATAVASATGTVTVFPTQPLLTPFGPTAVAALRQHFSVKAAELALFSSIAHRAGALSRQGRQRSSIVDALARLDHQRRLWSEVAIRDADLERLLRSADALVMDRANAPRGILLFGPPGTGKTLIAKCLAESTGCAFEATNIGHFKGQHLGESEAKTAAVWVKVRKKSPCILFIDECDTVLGARGSVDTEKFDKAITGAFIQEWDGMQDSSGVMLIGATNRKQDLDDAVLSRFATLIKIDLPTTGDRLKMINARLRKGGFSFAVGDEVGRITAGLSGRELDNALKQFTMEWQRNPAADLPKLMETFRAIRGKTTNVQSLQVLGWESLIASHEKKRELQNISVKLRSAEQMRAKGLTVSTGMLLFGPPGTGKTQAARILASESGLSFFKATTSDMKANYIGQSANKVREIFDKARSSAPSMLFIDEIDVIAPRRRGGSDDVFTNEVIGELLQQMDGINGASDVFVLAATNAPDAIDDALLSRFQTRIELPLPDDQERIDILRLMLKPKPCESLSDAAYAELAKSMEGMSGRDIGSMIHRAEGFAVNEIIDQAGDPEHAVIKVAHLTRAVAAQIASQRTGAR